MDNTNMPKITAKINRLLDVPNSKIRADATVYIADAFAIRGVKVLVILRVNGGVISFVDSLFFASF